MSKLSKDILGKIKKGQIDLKPKWYFRLLRGAIWSAVIFVIIFAALSSAIVIRNLLATDWELARSISDSSIKSILALLPFIWITVIILLILAGDKLFRQTKRGYKYRTMSIILASVIVSLALGTGLFAADADQPFENAIRENFKPYQAWEMKKRQRLVRPNHGAIAGEVQEIKEGKIRIRDFQNREWTVETNKTRYHNERIPEVGDKVGIMGKKVDEESFKAERVKSWQNLQKEKERRQKMKETLREVRSIK